MSSKTLRKICYILLFGFGAIELLAFIWVHVSYSSNLPTTPDKVSGHIHQVIVNHGFVAYATDREFRIYRWIENLQPFSIVCALAAIILGFRYGDFKMAPGRKLNE
jgi:hypothetical protein